MNEEIILDASVLADIFIKSKKRHALGCRLANYIMKNNIQVTVPMHAVVELKCAIDNERMNPGCGELASAFSDSNPLKLKTISIDQQFIKNYSDLSIPYIKAGDLIYILVAKKHSGILITEDKKQARVAKKLHIETYSVDEYLDKFD